MHWSAQAKCKDLPGNLFFEDYESTPEIAEAIDLVCLSCPVQRKCLSAGLKNKETGVWGGFYLSMGNIDKIKNEHKTKEVVDKLCKH